MTDDGLMKKHGALLERINLDAAGPITRASCDLPDTPDEAAAVTVALVCTVLQQASPAVHFTDERLVLVFTS